MFPALITLHVLVAFIMVGVILLQSGKGAEIGAAFGGSSQTIFGARGANTFLGKLTAVSATIFMLTSLSLAIMSKQRNYSRSEEHTSELQSRLHLVCRLLLDKKKNRKR